MLCVAVSEPIANSGKQTDVMHYRYRGRKQSRKREKVLLLLCVFVYREVKLVIRSTHPSNLIFSLMQISSLDSVVLIGEPLGAALKKALKACESDKIFVLTDTNTYTHCLPVLQRLSVVKHMEVLQVGAGETHKSIASAEYIWDVLTQHKADRGSVLINLGGGMIGDLGGFAASTYKRGIRFINMPTTLLSQVDASIGGKLGVNFGGLKNQVGLFKAPDYVIASTEFLHTLDRDNLLSGYAEMLKHALIYSAEHWKKLTEFDILAPQLNYEALEKLISKSIFIKNDFVKKDFREKNVRKALNFGHTVGHAIESWAIETGQPMLHGAAVAHGMVCEAYLSHKKALLDKRIVSEVKNLVHKLFGRIDNLSNNADTLMRLMEHDKKNSLSRINFSLISAIGEVELDKNATAAEIVEALNYYDEVE